MFLTCIVAPLAGARIEMTPSLSSVNWTESSLPSRERGLKSYPTEIIQTEALVAPLAGARIEILELKSSCASSMVAPLAGARIEIAYKLLGYKNVYVALLAGARIEMHGRWG